MDPLSTTQIISLTAAPITATTFQPYGQVIIATADGKPFDQQDAQLTLDQGVPRFYIMRLTAKGLAFSHITQHQHCTQCLGSLEGKEWFIAVAPPSAPDQFDISAIKAFKVPGTCFVKLNLKTWHAGPFFLEHNFVDFYNLELADTNITDHFTINIKANYNIAFQIKPSLDSTQTD